MRAQHTPAPWHLGDNAGDGISIHGENGLPICRMGGNITQENLQANAERIIACVDYCEGYPTQGLVDSMESGGLRGVMRDTRAPEVLAALQHTIAVLREAGRDGQLTVTQAESILIKARAALAQESI